VRQLSSEPSGKTLGPSRSESFAEASDDLTIRRSVRRSNHYAEASDDPTIMPKRYTSEPSGKPPGPSPIETIYASHRAGRRACVEPSAEAPRASRRVRRRARLEPSAEAIHERAIWQATGPVSNCMRCRASRRAHQAVHRAIRRASRCRGTACDPALEPQLAGAADTQPNPLDYSL